MMSKDIHPSDLVPILVDAEWLENYLHEMELCIELGGNTAKRRYEILKEHVIDGLACLKAPPSWKVEKKLIQRWDAICRKAAKGKPKAPPQPPKPEPWDRYRLIGLGYELFYAIRDMFACCEIGGQAAQKRYESCAKTVTRILGRKPPSWTKERNAHLETERMFRVLARTANKSGEPVFPPFTPEELDDK